MTEKHLMEYWNYTEADLNANQRGQLTEKQKAVLAEKQEEQKSYNSCLGAIVVGALGFLLVGALFNPVRSAIQELSAEGGDPMQSVAILFVIGILLALIVGVTIVSLRRMNRKADHVIRNAKGTVNFVWVESKVRTQTGSGHKTVRSLEMRVGTETKFVVEDRLPSLINQGEEWIFYYTSYPFMFLSAEKTGK